jgi:hypothetical protein
MKVKTWHIGCLVVLIAAALYFLLNTHEGLVTPPATSSTGTTPPPATSSTGTTPPPASSSTGGLGTTTSNPVSAPMPPGPTGTTGGASMAPPTVPTPFPTPSSASAPSYSLTCTASPVSGMVGSAAAMPETPAAWNVTQPPSGWNSKNGYTTTGN